MNKIGKMAIGTGVIMVVFAFVYWAWMCHYSFGIFILGTLLTLSGILLINTKEEEWKK